MNLVELNIILYYADYLSLAETSTTVTDNCKYYMIYGSPMNVSYIVNSQPFFDVNNKYYLKALHDYEMIKNKYGDSGLLSFIDNVCNLAALGCINARQMLACIHRYSNKYERKQALDKYNKWISNQIYTHLQINEKGELERS